jgi:hypothetical protein
MVLDIDIGGVVDAIRLRCFVTSRMGFAPSVLSDYGACLVKCRAMILAALLLKYWQTGIEVGSVLCVPMPEEIILVFATYRCVDSARVCRDHLNVQAK